MFDDEAHRKKREYMREWNAKNKERAHAIQHASYVRNIETKQEYDKVYRVENAERRSEYNAQYYQEHKDEIIKRCTEWLSNNPDNAQAYRHRRRATIQANGGGFTAKEWKELKDRYGNRCLCCGRNDVKLSPDHVMPLALGGSGKIDNIQPLCQSCNCSKRAKYIDFR